MISIIGSGRVGSTLAMILVQRNIDDVTLVDIIPNLPEGEALDLSHMASELGVDARISGSNDYSALKGSDIVVVTAGLARKPGMTRMDLLTKNAGIIKSVSQEVARYAPNCKLIMVTNPLDAMTLVALKASGFPKNRVFGMSGMLDLSRFKQLLADYLHVSRSSIDALVIGEHGESMTPLPSYTSVSGIPLRKLLSEQQIDEAIEKTRKVAAEVIAKRVQPLMRQQTAWRGWSRPSTTTRKQCYLAPLTWKESSASVGSASESRSSWVQMELKRFSRLN